MYGADCDTGHYLVVAKVNERLAVFVFVFIVRSLDLYKAKSPSDIELVNKQHRGLMGKYLI